MKEQKGFGFGLGKMKELAEAFKKAQQVQEGAKDLQQELETMEITADSDDGLVTVVMSGNQEPKSVQIKEEALSKGAEELSNIVTNAVRNAHQKSTDIMREKMENLTSGLGLPGL